MRGFLLGGMFLLVALPANLLGVETVAALENAATSEPTVNRFRAELVTLTAEEREAALLDAATALAAEEKSYAERVDALRRLGLLQDAAAIPVLRAVLGDPALGDEARRVLQRIPGPVAEVALLNALARETDPRLRAGLLSSLGARRVEAVIPAAVKAAAEREPTLAEAGLRTLGEIKTGASLSALLGVKVREAQRALRWQLLLETCGALLGRPDGGASHGRVVQTLCELEAQEEFPRLRQAARVLQLQYGLRSAEECLSGEDPALRAAALIFLRRARDIDSGKLLLDYFSRRAKGREFLDCLMALESRRQTEALPLLYSLLNRQLVPEARAAVLGTMGVLGGADEAGTLAVALDSPDKIVAETARAALLALQGGDVGGAFAGLFADTSLSVAVRVQLLDVARRRWLYTATPGAIALLTDADAELRREALKTLERLAGPEHLPALRTAVPTVADSGQREKINQLCQRLEQENRR